MVYEVEIIQTCSEQLKVKVEADSEADAIEFVESQYYDGAYSGDDWETPLHDAPEMTFTVINKGENDLPGITDKGCLSDDGPNTSFM